MADTHAVAVDGSIQVDPQLLFQRLVAEQYELVSRPSALFEPTGLM